jgi:hypothetical protein
MRIAGVASGVGEGSALDAGIGVTTGAADGDGDGDGSGTGDGDGAGVTPASSKQAIAKRPARMLPNFAMRVWFLCKPKKVGSQGRSKEP